VQDNASVLGPGSLVPPLVAVVLALGTGRLVPALGLATLGGAFVLHGPVHGVPLAIRDYVIRNIVDTGHLTVIGFVLALLGMVAVMNRSGGTAAVVEAARSRVSTPRGTRVGGALLGCMVFFDDYANCMIVGPALRPLFDRFGISRERLAFVVDATAAPIAGLVPLSTWVGYEIGLLDEVLRGANEATSGFSMLLEMLPYRFYCVFALMLVFITAIWERELGPMIAAERRALARLATHEEPDGADPVLGGRPVDALLPLGTVLGGTAIGFIVAGGAVGVLVEDPEAILSFGFWRATLGSVQDGPRVLLLAALGGAALSIIVPVAGKRATHTELIGALKKGVRVASGALLVLFLAWALAAVSSDLKTGAYLSHLVTGKLAFWAVPLVTFLTSAGVAFATGTSWGTMAMMLPTALPLALGFEQAWLAPVTAAAVLDGAIFGDHCSPISDTTVMSSIGSECDHLEHVRTQMPYAAVAMVVALGAGYGATTLGLPAVTCWMLGLIALVLVVRFLGKSVAAG
jgi:Na+/H+ antiporter NhaC